MVKYEKCNFGSLSLGDTFYFSHEYYEVTTNGANGGYAMLLKDCEKSAYFPNETVVEIVNEFDTEQIEDNKQVENHYAKGSMQAIEIMQTFMSQDEFIGFLKGNVIKYLSRADYKGQKEKDLEKAKTYSWWLALAKLGRKIIPTNSVPEDWVIPPIL